VLWVLFGDSVAVLVFNTWATFLAGVAAAAEGVEEKCRLLFRHWNVPRALLCSILAVGEGLKKPMARPAWGAERWRSESNGKWEWEDSLGLKI
jgi:hypothetical protein